MNLPTIETPKYALSVPSTGKTIEYRPFLVKEEKILLLAQESEDPNQNLTALKDIIKNCTFDSINLNDLTTVDLEYIFLQIRAKSVGEIAEVNIKCQYCESQTPVEINLENIKVEQPKEKLSNKIMLTDEVGVVMKQISTADIEKISTIINDSSKQLTATIIASIENIFDNNNVYQLKDVSFEESETFINSLNRSQMNKIEEYIANTPKLKYDVEFECISCKKKNKNILEGLESFFS